MATTIQISDKTSKNFDLKNLETFVNSDDFADIVLWFQMSEWETWETILYDSFKKEMWLYKSIKLLREILRR